MKGYEDLYKSDDCHVTFTHLLTTPSSPLKHTEVVVSFSVVVVGTQRQLEAAIGHGSITQTLNTNNIMINRG